MTTRSVGPTHCVADDPGGADASATAEPTALRNGRTVAYSPTVKRNQKTPDESSTWKTVAKVGAVLLGVAAAVTAIFMDHRPTKTNRGGKKQPFRRKDGHFERY